MKIWEDRWLSRPHFLAPHTRTDATANVKMVADLIYLDLRMWNDIMLSSLFSQQEVETIKTIPISLENREDRVIWGGTINGIFSVNSAYHLHREIQSNNLRLVP